MSLSDQVRSTHQIYTGKRPKQYAKGPDVMNKSKRTQERYRKQNKDQTSLTGHFGFTRVMVSPTGADTLSITQSTSESAPQIIVMSESVLPPSGSRARSASVLSDPSIDAGGVSGLWPSPPATSRDLSVTYHMITL